MWDVPDMLAVFDDYQLSKSIKWSVHYVGENTNKAFSLHKWIPHMKCLLRIFAYRGMEWKQLVQMLFYDCV